MTSVCGENYAYFDEKIGKIVCYNAETQTVNRIPLPADFSKKDITVCITENELYFIAENMLFSGPLKQTPTGPGFKNINLFYPKLEKVQGIIYVSKSNINYLVVISTMKKVLLKKGEEWLDISPKEDIIVDFLNPFDSEKDLMLFLNMESTYNLYGVYNSAENLIQYIKIPPPPEGIIIDTCLDEKNIYQIVVKGNQSIFYKVEMSNPTVFIEPVKECHIACNVFTFEDKIFLSCLKDLLILTKEGNVLGFVSLEDYLENDEKDEGFFYINGFKDSFLLQSLKNRILRVKINQDGFKFKKINY